ncbi:MAG: hypothetical protein WCP46_05625 [Alphaproteobacteria bacterium]
MKNFIKLLLLSSALILPAMAAQASSAQISKFRQAPYSVKPQVQEDQQNKVNKLFAKAALLGNTYQVWHYLNLPAGQAKPDQYGIRWGLSNAASYPLSSSKLEILELLLNLPDGQIKPNQDALNDGLMVAANSGNEAAARLLLNRPAGEIMPNQRGIVDAHQEAVLQRKYAIIEMLKPYLATPTSTLVAPAISADSSRVHSLATAVSSVRGAVATPTPLFSYVMGDEEKAKLKVLQSAKTMDQRGMNRELRSAVKKFHQGVVKWLLSSGSQLKPNQDGVNYAFEYAVESNQQELIEMMLDRPLRPNQKGINDAFSIIAQSGKKEIMEWMLSLAEGKGKPDQAGVNDAFNGVVHVVIRMIVDPKGTMLGDSSMFGRKPISYALEIIRWMFKPR